MIRFALLMMLASNLYAADASVDIDTAAKVYQAAAVREQVRATLGSMPGRIRQMFTADGSAKLSEQQLAAISAAAERGFRISVFEPPALVALAANLDSVAVKKTLAFLNGDLGRRMVAADLALSALAEATIDKVMSGELAAPATPQRDVLMKNLEHAARTTESTVKIFLSMGRAVAIGTAIGSGRDPIAAEERARKSSDATRGGMEEGMNEPLRRYMAYGYRDLKDADLKKLLAFLESAVGKRYVNAYIETMGAGFDAMGKRCGEQLGESLRELAQVEAQAPAAATRSPAARVPGPVP